VSQHPLPHPLLKRAHDRRHYLLVSLRDPSGSHKGALPLALITSCTAPIASKQSQGG
jgi:hypothetical protein